MIRLVFTLRRKAGLSLSEFQRYWREVHGPLVARHSTTLNILRYVQLHTLDDPVNAQLAGARGAMEPPYDGVAELWWTSRDLLAASFGNAVHRTRRSMVRACRSRDHWQYSRGQTRDGDRGRGRSQVHRLRQFRNLDRQGAHFYRSTLTATPLVFCRPRRRSHEWPRTPPITCSVVTRFSTSPSSSLGELEPRNGSRPANG
jgi:hypothetical protein